MDSADKTTNTAMMKQLVSHYSLSTTEKKENGNRLGSNTGSFAANSTMKVEYTGQLNGPVMLL